MIAATGFGLPAWAADLLRAAAGPRRLALLRRQASTAHAQACGAMLVDGGDRRVRDRRRRSSRPAAAAASWRCCTGASPTPPRPAAGLLFVETGERVPERPSASYRNILRAGFEEAYLRPNWLKGCGRQSDHNPSAAP